MSIDYDALKERTRAVWSLGDYERFSPRLLPAARELVDACAISAGQEVLDVAAGNGNLAVLAAQEGAAVVASDITPALVDKGRSRAEREGLDIDWVVADAEDLPFEDARFDCAASVFGAMFAPRPELVARELFRVVRRGNTVGMANWAPGSFSDRLFALHSRYVPPPEGLPRPIEWGDEHVVRQRFDGLAGTIEVEPRILRWEFESAESMVASVEDSCGPNIAISTAVGPERAAELRKETLDLVEEFNQGSGSVVLDLEYVIVVARRRG